MFLPWSPLSILSCILALQEPLAVPAPRDLSDPKAPGACRACRGPGVTTGPREPLGRWDLRASPAPWVPRECRASRDQGETQVLREMLDLRVRKPEE